MYGGIQGGNSRCGLEVTEVGVLHWKGERSEIISASLDDCIIHQADGVQGILIGPKAGEVTADDNALM